MIIGAKVKTPTKRELAAEVATLLGIAGPQMSSGSTVVSELLTRIVERLTGQPAGHLTAYEKAAVALERVGLTYDPFWDTSEAQEAGGSTVTNRAYSRLRTSLSGRPRCFVLNRTDAREGASWEVDDDRVYRYDNRVTGRGPLNDAGPGSLIIYYNTSSASSHPMHYTAAARVRYIGPGWGSGPWEALIEDYVPFVHPVPAGEVQILGRNGQHAITEITSDLYEHIVAAGGEPRALSGREDSSRDVGGLQAARRIDLAYPIESIVLEGDRVPEQGGAEVDLVVAPLLAPVYTEAGDGRVLGGHGLPGDTKRDRAADKVVEERAVAAALKHLEASGWTLRADRQRDGVGYDLEMERDGRVLHVEVKGVRGTRLEFNVTAKEWWRAETDPLFVVAAVTGVLRIGAIRVNMLSREEVLGASRVATQFRLRVQREEAPVSAV